MCGPCAVTPVATLVEYSCCNALNIMYIGC